MVRRSVRSVLLPAVCLLWLVGGSQERLCCAAESPEARTERLMRGLASEEEFAAAAAEQLPRLTALVDGENSADCELALRALARMKRHAAPAVVRIVRRLGAPAQSTRRAAAEALIAIGDDSIPPLRNSMRSASGRTRAGVVYALSRLGKLDIGELELAAKDPDPRVRAAAADALSRIGRRGVAPLAELLQDPEPAVAVVAAQGLRSSRDDLSIAVARLSEALSRPGVGWVAAETLAAYGVEARRAIPALIRSYPLGPPDRHFPWDMVEQTLGHLGPPDEADLPRLCEILRRGDSTRILAARSLAQLETKGKEAARDLEEAARAAAARFKGLGSGRNPAPPDENAGPYLLSVSAETCAAAVWHVTRDTGRFIALAEELAVVMNEPLSFPDPTPWLRFSVEDCRAIEPMLRHANVNVRRTALLAVNDLGGAARPLGRLLLEIAEGSDRVLSKEAIRALAAIGESDIDGAARVLISKLEDGTLSVDDFADAAGAMHLRSADVQVILERGLLNLTEAWHCARALARTTSERPRTARSIIDAVKKGVLAPRSAIEAFRAWPDGEEAVLEFLARQVLSEDYWARYEALDALGSLGPKARSVRERLESCLQDKSMGIRLQAAKGLFLITGDPERLEEQLKVVSGDREWRDEGLRALAGLKTAGGSFVRFASAAIDPADPWTTERAIDALAAIATPEATNVLESVAQSTDWVIRSKATTALRRLADPDVRVGTERVGWLDRTPSLKPSAVREDAPELKLIRAAARWPFDNPNGVELIRAVNTLQRLGKEQSLAILEKYVETAGEFDRREIVAWIVHVLFEPIRLGDQIPHPGLAVHLDDKGADEMRWPLNPLEISQDIPFMMGMQIASIGPPWEASGPLIWARRYGVIRDEPLVPANPALAAEALLSSRRFAELDEDSREAASNAIRIQAQAMIDGLIGPPTKPAGPFGFFRNFDDARWTELVKEAAQHRVQWDSAGERFVVPQKPQ